MKESSDTRCFFAPVDKPCPLKRSRECPVHGPILQRHKLKHHFLRKDRDHWHKRDVLITVCGIHLYDRYTLEQVGDLMGPFGKKTKEQLLEERWLHVEPPPSKVKGIDIYYQIAWYKHELAVVQANATCKPCAKKGLV